MRSRVRAPDTNDVRTHGVRRHDRHRRLGSADVALAGVGNAVAARAVAINAATRNHATTSERATTTIQRLIAVDVKEGVNPRKDMPPLKVLAQIRTFLSTKLMDRRVELLQAGLDLSKLEADETLYITGHGKVGRTYGLSAAELLDLLNDETKGVPERFGGIVFLVCNAGTQDESVEPPASLVSDVAAGLNHPGVTVKGAKGFTFGAGSTSTAGLNRVMKAELWGLDSLDADDAGTAASILSSAALDDELRRALKGVKGVNLAKLQEVGLTVGDVFDDEADIVHYIEAFLKEKTTIDNALESAVAKTQPAKKGPEAADLALMSDKLENDTEFQQAVTQQEDLYDRYGFFFPQGESAYASAVSPGRQVALRSPTGTTAFLKHRSVAERAALLKSMSTVEYGKAVATLEQDLAGVKKAFVPISKEVGAARAGQFDSVKHKYATGDVAKADEAAKALLHIAKAIETNEFDKLPELYGSIVGLGRGLGFGSGLADYIVSMRGVEAFKTTAADLKRVAEVAQTRAARFGTLLASHITVAANA